MMRNEGLLIPLDNQLTGMTTDASYTIGIITSELAVIRKAPFGNDCLTGSDRKNLAGDVCMKNKPFF